MLSHMISAEEKVMAAESRSEMWQKRAEDTNEAKTRSVRQLEATVTELRIQNSQLQDFNSSLRSEVTSNEQQLQSYKDDLCHAKTHSEELERISKETIRSELEKVELLCGKMEQEVAKEAALRMEKEEDLVQQSTELEELRAAQEEATQLITKLQLDLDTTEKQRSQFDSELSSLKTDVRERDVQISLLTEEVQIGKEENRRLRQQKETSLSPSPLININPNIPNFSEPVACTPVIKTGVRSSLSSRVTEQSPSGSIFNFENETGFASAQSSIARTVRSDVTTDLSHLDAELEKITNRWKHEMPPIPTDGTRSPLPQLPRFSAEQPAHHTLAYLKQRYS